MLNSYFREILVQKKNYFELLKISPEMSLRDIVVYVKQSQDIDPYLKTEVIKAINNPLDRFMNEVYTFHGPNYGAEIPPENKEKYRLFLEYITNIPIKLEDIDYRMTYYLYNKVANTPEFSAISGKLSANRERLSNLVGITKDDPWVCHTLAIIFVKYALSFGNAKEYKNTVTYWGKFASNWSKILSNKIFVSMTETAKHYKDAKKTENITLEFKKTISDIQDYFKTEFNLNLLQNKIFDALNLLRFEHTIEVACKENGVNTIELSDSMLSDLFLYFEKLINNVKDKSELPDVFTDFIDLTDNYQTIFELLDMLDNLEIPAVFDERILLYIVNHCKKIIRGLTEQNDFKTVAADICINLLSDLFSEASLLKEGKIPEQTFEITRNIEELMMAVQNAGIVCSNQFHSSGNKEIGRMALAIIEILPKDRLVDVKEGEKISLKDVREQLSKILNDGNIILGNKLNELLKQFETAVNSQDIKKVELTKKEILNYPAADYMAELKRIMAGILNSFSVKFLDEIINILNKKPSLLPIDDGLLQEMVVSDVISKYISEEDKEDAKLRQKENIYYIIYWCASSAILYFSFGFNRILFYIGLVVAILVGLGWGLLLKSDRDFKFDICAKRGCRRKAGFTFNGNRNRVHQTRVCGRHADELEKLIRLSVSPKNRTTLNENQKTIISRCVKYLKMAMDLDANNDVIRKNYDTANNILSSGL